MAEKRPVAILAALEEEVAAIRRALRAWAGVVTACTGDGPRRAASGAARLLEQHRPSALIGAGIAGALSPGLAVGDIVVARRVRSAIGDTPGPDKGLLRRALSAGNAKAGTLVTVDRPVVSAVAKAALAAAAGGDAVLAVDMESAAWAREAAVRGIPYLIVRVISDTAEEELPDFLPDCVGADGSIRRGEVARRALLHPGSWGTLLRMRRRLLVASGALGAFLAEIVGAGLVPAGGRPR
ncbi:MAG: hypothetical protein WEB59_14885 [Thermoanaerobaculia bacterium]